MLELIFRFINFIQPILVPVCFLMAWSVVGIVFWSLWAAVRDGVLNTQRLHKIPCANCQFFTGDYHLKCTVHPSIALSEDAINCSDYQA